MVKAHTPAPMPPVRRRTTSTPSVIHRPLFEPPDRWAAGACTAGAVGGGVSPPAMTVVGVAVEARRAIAARTSSPPFSPSQATSES